MVVLDGAIVRKNFPGHSYHFRGKPELLAGISDENLLVQLEIEYQGDITSCNKVENYLQYSEYDYEDFSNSSDSSHVHSEQVRTTFVRHLANGEVNPDLTGDSSSEEAMRGDDEPQLL